MMNRRTLITYTGVAVTGGSAVLATGAFTSVEANRDITVNVADDTDALLGLDPDSLDNSAYATESDGVVGIDVSQDGDRDFDGEGVSPFALTTIEEVIEVTNQGTQDVAVFVESNDPSLGELDGDFELFATDPDDGTDNRANLREGTDIDDLQVIGPGDSFALGFEVDARDKSDDELDELEDDITDLEVTIIADAEEVNGS